MPPKPTLTIPAPAPFTHPPPTHYYTYTIQRGEQGVLTYEPYKSHLLPLWRFRSVTIARQSSHALYSEFERFAKEEDFVGMDMCRKFIQMGMTRAKRYANYKGGRKFVGEDGEKSEDGDGRKVQLEKSEGHEGREEKLRASEVFKEIWGRCRGDEVYAVLRERFLKEKKEWEEGEGPRKEAKEEEEEEEAGVEETNTRSRKRRKVGSI